MGSLGVARIDGTLMEDFDLKLKLREETDEDTSLDINSDVLTKKAEVSGEEDDDDEEDFTFITNPDGSPISADDIFQNGQIRPVFPLFNQNILFYDDNSGSFAKLRPPFKKVFVEKRERASSSSSSSGTDDPEGPYCEWKGKAIEASREACKKSNSTGFSKLWRFRDLGLRSNSDGKDAFIFLNHPNTKTEDRNKKNTAKSSGSKVTASAAERHYVASRKMKQENKRKSYLPYRQGIVGIFTNMNGISRDVHPF
ncbi:hypothetical protein K2173_008268 [Erythroxylum novogranatense]|uniref:Uncharacterized protein n=1 Tax=Erythroxylum novogranatense TaxID=1862640 RepID=A0AAV8U784_9ROSI|nr:hypothetical protein K2173_008268 [Erythroxylum novogranatense]